MRLFKQGLLFLAGGCGYYALELLWRGWSHGSMFLAGGSCFLLLGKLPRAHIPLLLKGLLGACVITTVELGTGLLFNRHYQVWDYRHLPLNFFGQICLPFSLLWIPLSLGAMALYDALAKALSSKK